MDVNNKKEKEIEKKFEQVENKNFHNLNKDEEIDIKNLETRSKLFETKGKMGEKIETKKFLDNSTKKGKIVRTLIVCLIFGIIILGGYLALKYTGMLEKFNSLQDIKDFIVSGGNFSLVIFIVIQFLQVTFLPIPAFLTTVAGAIIFGPWKAFFLSLVSIILGSIFAFWLGRRFGKKILYWIAGKEDAEKWIKKLTNGKYAFFLMMLFPAFPDDILCIAAGVTNMSTKFFLITNLITRPIGIICICFIGSGTLIPYHGWGLIVWAIMIVAIIILFILSIKYQSKIEKFVDKLARKMSFRSQSNSKVKIENLTLSDGVNESINNDTNTEN